MTNTQTNKPFWPVGCRRGAALLLALLLAAAPLGAAAENADTVQDAAGAPAASTADTAATQTATAEQTYADYRAQWADAASATATVTLDIFTYTHTGQVEQRTDIAGAEKALFTGEESAVTFTFQVPETGLYELSVLYYTIEGKGSDIVRTLAIDGAQPFDQAEDLTFGRVWAYEGDVQTDYQGNEIRPSSTEVHTWRTVSPRDASGYYNDNFCYYLTAGTHTLTLTAVKEPMVLGAIAFVPPTVLTAYADYLQQHAGDSTQDGDKVQAEAMTAYSAKSIYATCSKTSAAIEPASTGIEKLNIIDGTKFKLPEQWITWTMAVPADGYYQIAVRYKQSERDGAYCSRRLLIDGEQPFAEAGYLTFDYSSSWDTAWLADGAGTPYRFWLEAGDHEITLQVTLGAMAEVVSAVAGIVTELNTCYREIYVITGAEADQYRDYQFEKLIPDTLEKLAALRDELQAILNGLQQGMGKGSFTTAFESLIFDIDTMVSNPRKIASAMDSFKSNLGTLGEWQQTALEQPISFDWIWAMSPESKLPPAGKGFLAEVGYQCQLFISSFIVDYSSIGRMTADDSAAAIKVWVTSGRDQSKIIRRMIDQDFTPQHNVSVDLQLVAGGTLLRSVLAGNGPDVAMQLAASEPMNFALRGAVLDLRQFGDFAEVTGRFHAGAINPFTYLDATYALPETFSFPMLFYRTDIFEEMGWEVPETWDDVYDLIIELSAYHMEFGLSFDTSSYIMMLMQAGVEFYNGDRTAVNTTTDTSLRVFDNWLSFYTEYGLAVSYDFANRFRSGEMPIGIADFIGTYNQFSVFAPEIEGQWAFVQVPGTRQADGTVDHTVNASGTGVVILSATKAPDAAWDFLKWWTDAEAQVEYGTELESVLGQAARYASANKEAVSMLAWPVSDYRNIMVQWDSADCLPQAPGSYIVTRYLGFAARAVVNQGANPGQTMIHYTKLINEELERKKTEFLYLGTE